MRSETWADLVGLPPMFPTPRLSQRGDKFMLSDSAGIAVSDARDFVYLCVFCARVDG
jgi:hypothetical protein